MIDGFHGQFEHTLDTKGRLILPAAFREQLSDGLVLTRGYDRCIDVWTPEAYEGRLRSLRQLAREDRTHRALRLFVTSSAVPLELDSQHRITVPGFLREYANLGRDVMVLGDDDKAVIWDRAGYADFMGEYEDAIANLDGVLGSS